jgi:hypothetical protein
VTTLYKSLSQTDWYSQSRSSLRFLVVATKGVASSTSVSNGFCSRWLAPSCCSSRAELTGSQLPNSQSQSYVTTDGQSASLFWHKAPIWGLRPDFYFCQTVAGLFMWDTLSDERTDLSFTIAASPCHSVILGSESRGTHDHILLSHNRPVM